MNNFSYDYEEEPKKKSKYKNPDDMLRTIPEIDPNRHKKGIVGLVLGICSFIISFIIIIWAWVISFLMSVCGLYFSLKQRKIKKTKISSVGLVINIAGILLFAALIVLDIFTDALAFLYA